MRALLQAAGLSALLRKWGPIAGLIPLVLLLLGGHCFDPPVLYCHTEQDCRDSPNYNPRHNPDPLCYQGICCRSCDCTSSEACVIFGCPECFERATGPSCPEECGSDEDCAPGEHCILGYSWRPRSRLCNGCVPAAFDPSCATRCGGAGGPCPRELVCVDFAEEECDSCAQLAAEPKCANECLSDADCEGVSYGDTCVKRITDGCNECKMSFP